MFYDFIPKIIKIVLTYFYFYSFKMRYMQIFVRVTVIIRLLLYSFYKDAQYFLIIPNLYSDKKYIASDNFFVKSSFAVNVKSVKFSREAPKSYF